MARYQIQAELPDNTLIDLVADTAKASAVCVARHLAKTCANGWADSYHVFDNATERYVFSRKAAR